MSAILFLIVLMASPMKSAATAQTDLIKGVCQKTSNYAGCVEALETDSRTTKTTDLVALANICLDLAVANLTDSLGLVKTMEQDPKMSPNLKAVLGGCVKNYQYSVESFRSAISDLKFDVLTANYDIKLAIDGPQSCSDDLKKRGLSVPEILKRNNYVHLFSNIGDVITNDTLNPPSSPKRVMGRKNLVN